MSAKHRAPGGREPVEVRRRAAARAGVCVVLAAVSATALSMWATRPDGGWFGPSAPEPQDSTSAPPDARDRRAEASAAQPAEESAKRGERTHYRPVHDLPGGQRAAVYRTVSGEELVEELLERASSTLTPEEEDLVRRYGAEGIGAIVAQTEYEFLHASEDERAEKQRRYNLALNLVPKLEGSEPEEPSPEGRAEQQRYLALLAARKKEWARLPEEERARREMDLKDRFFAQSEQK